MLTREDCEPYKGKQVGMLTFLSDEKEVCSENFLGSSGIGSVAKPIIAEGKLESLSESAITLGGEISISSRNGSTYAYKFPMATIPYAVIHSIWEDSNRVISE